MMQSKVPKQKLPARSFCIQSFTYTLLYALLKLIETFPYAVLVHKSH